MCVIKTVDQVNVSGAAAARTDHQFSAKLSLGTRGEGPGFFMPDVHPLHLSITAANRIGDGVKAVANDTIDAFYARFNKPVN